MTIPDFQSIMLPLLQFSSDSKEHSLTEAKTHLASYFSLSDEELNEMLPSQRAKKFYNRLAWAKVYLVRAGLLEDIRRGVFTITKRGLKVLSSDIKKIDIRFLTQYPEFIAFRDRSKKEKKATEYQIEESPSLDVTPEEALEAAYEELRSALSSQILEHIHSCSPAFFERLVVEVLVAMGYGGSIRDAGKAIGRSGDEGIDGIIREDRLGLDVIYLQAKRWQGKVSRPEIQKFVGALHGKRAKKGIFITTSDFSKEAISYVANIDPRVILVNGQQLAEYMIDYNIGVSTSVTYAVKNIDNDYFVED